MNRSIATDKIFDWASKKGPSEHIKFDHLFQICYIIIKDLNKELIDMTFLPSMNNLTSNILKLTEHQYVVQNSR